MHIAVCDDNIADRKQTERLLGRASDRRLHTTGVLYIDSYGNVEAVLRSPMLYDAFFIDMTSGPVNGFQLARKLIDAGVVAPIILCISTIDYPAVIEAALAKVPEDVTEASNHDILRRQLQKQILYLRVIQHLAGSRAEPEIGNGSHHRTARREGHPLCPRG